MTPGHVKTISVYYQPPKSTQLLIPAGYVNLVLVCLVGVKAGCVYLCRVAGDYLPPDTGKQCIWHVRWVHVTCNLLFNLLWVQQRLYIMSNVRNLSMGNICELKLTVAEVTGWWQAKTSVEIRQKRFHFNSRLESFRFTVIIL